MKTGGLIPAATSRKRWLLVGTHGSMTIPGIFFFTIIMAIGGLAIDIQRVYGVHGQMQAFVDDAALAGAAELDGQNDAIRRAFRAAYGDQDGGPQIEIPTALARFSPDGMTVPVVQRVTFLREIGATPDDDDVLCSFEDGAWVESDCNTDPDLSRHARFVEVVARNQVGYGLIQIAGVFQESLELRATAGFRRSICNSVPLALCNPAEATQGSGADFSFTRGRQLVGALSNGTPGPASFRYLAGVAPVDQAVARVSPGTACTGDIVATAAPPPPVSAAINVRFDIYEAPFINPADGDYAPAPSTGTGSPMCGSGLSATSIPFPLDDCFMAEAPGKTGSCTTIGDGRWAREQYWKENHPGVLQPATTIDGVQYIDAESPIGGWSRYQTYRYEVDNGLLADGEQVCSTSSRDLRPDHDRRVLYVPIVNCIGDAAKIAEGAPVKAYAKIFLTEPAGHVAWSDKVRTIDGATLRWPTIIPDIAYEIVDVVKPDDSSGRLHVYPTLFR